MLERAGKAPSYKRESARRLSGREVAELAASYEAGATVYELALRFKIHRVTVAQHLHRLGVKTRAPRLDESHIAEAARLYELGWSLARIGRRFQADPSTVWRALRARGIRMRDTQGRERS
jgi:hypothetical protein